MLKLVTVARREVMRERPDPRAKLRRVRRVIHAAGRPPWWQRRGNVPDGRHLILYRSRAEVLEAAHAHDCKGQPYRLRLSGLPLALQPWLAMLFHDWRGAMLSRDAFDRLWHERGAAVERQHAWQALHDAAGADDHRIDMTRLLALLHSRNPPVELIALDPGDVEGPVLGTIHAAKGREMDHVTLVLPREATGHDDPEDEARVLFVGASRARQSLRVVRGQTRRNLRLDGGRVAFATGDASALLEIGRPGDFDFPLLPDSSPAGEGVALQISFDGARVQVNLGPVIVARGTPQLTAALRELRARLAGGDYRPLQAAFQPMRGLGPCTHITEGADGRMVLHLVPVIAGLAEVRFG